MPCHWLLQKSVLLDIAATFHAASWIAANMSIKEKKWPNVLKAKCLNVKRVVDAAWDHAGAQCHAVLWGKLFSSPQSIQFHYLPKS